MNREKCLEKIFKFTCVIGLLSFLGIFPGFLICVKFLEEQEIIDVMSVLIVLLSLCGIILIYFIFFGEIILDHVQAEKISFNTRDLRNYLEEKLKNTDFKEMISVKTESVENVKIYVNKSINDRLTYLYYIEGNSLDKETINEVSDVVDQKIVEYYNDNAPKEKKDVILLLSVDKFSPLLKYYTNRNLIQDTVLREGHIMAVYVQEEGRLYVTKQVRGYGISFYKRLRKELFDILEIQNVEKVSK